MTSELEQYASIVWEPDDLKGTCCMSVHEWPFIKIHETKFFGYAVAIGICVDQDERIPYVEFWYNDILIRYCLPEDKTLRKDLAGCVAANITQLDTDPNNMYAKVYITRVFGGGYRLEWA